MSVIHLLGIWILTIAMGVLAVVYYSIGGPFEGAIGAFAASLVVALLGTHVMFKNTQPIASE